MSLGSNGVDQMRLLQKITMLLRETNFCINCTSLVCFAPTFMHLRNDPKCTQILRNALKHWYRVQSGGLVVFVAKKSQCDFVARTFVLIAPVQYVLHQLSCTYETIPNAPKYYETHRNISLGSNGVDLVRSLKKIQL